MMVGAWLISWFDARSYPKAEAIMGDRMVVSPIGQRVGNPDVAPARYVVSVSASRWKCLVWPIFSITQLIPSASKDS